MQTIEDDLNKLQVKFQGGSQLSVTENKKLQARVFALEESRTSTKVNQVIDRLDNVIKVVNTQSAENYHLDQSVQDIQQELTMLRQTVNSWNEEQQDDEEEQQDVGSFQIHCASSSLH